MSEVLELQELENVNVWGHSQATLEGQALKELEIFSEDNKQTFRQPYSEKGAFDINHYLKKQEELKKKQEYKRTLKLKDDHVSNAVLSQKNKPTCKRQNDTEIDCHIKAKKIKSNKVEKLSIQDLNGDFINSYENGHFEKLEEATSTAFNNEKSVIKKCNLLNNLSKNKVNCSARKGKKRSNSENTSESETSGSEYLPSEDGESDCEYGYVYKREGTNSNKSKVQREANKRKEMDDGCYNYYKERLEEYYKKIEIEEANKQKDEDAPEYITISGGLKIPGKSWNNLYSYQKDGVKWMWNVHQKLGGGLLGDEMGLGKTVQVIVFLHALSYSQVKSKYGMYVGLGPTIIVTPATVIHQWVQHFHEWAPEFRVAVLHSSGSFKGDKLTLIKDINNNKDIIVTTYSSILKYKDALLELNWHYLILDEGHKIRNPGAKVTVALKKIRTLHRLMLTGSPMQNNLQELWCLIDFINPGTLGTLPVFLEQFALPITRGGYVNSTPLQEATALSMATILKDKITKCMLRRTKNVVQKYINLPNKTEQVLFCSLSTEQRDLYKEYLLSDQVQLVLGRVDKYLSQNQMKANVLIAITQLRKICNHPHLHSYKLVSETDPSFSGTQKDPFGYYKRSGKMLVVAALLKIWKNQKHRVLLFTQARGMISIFQKFLEQHDYKYLKMDGSTSVSSRQSIIDTFNQDNTIDVFLLTTKVGGLGLNLVGADRVIIYDPDWNPATDTQARERAWRIGQEKQVTIYRLLSAGTIEEKIYRRQVFKQLLANKVLVDPTAQKFFRTSDLYDIFSLQEEPDQSNIECANIFQNTRIAVQKKIDEKKERNKVCATESVTLSEDKIRQMRELAQKIAKSVGCSSSNSEEQELKLTHNVVGADPGVTKTKIPKEGKRKRTFSNNKKDKRKSGTKVDLSGRVDGERVDGLLKIETNKISKQEKEQQQKNQEDYIIEKIFSSNGVHMALQHDSVLKSTSAKQKSVSVEYEANCKADLALKALENSIQ